MKPNCYLCKWRGDVPGDAHSCCRHPKAAGSGDAIEGIVKLLSGQYNSAMVELRIQGHPTGIEHGWFVWPVNFDPTWLLNCEGFESRSNEKATTKV